jgi:ribonuclease D
VAAQAHRPIDREMPQAPLTLAVRDADVTRAAAQLAGHGRIAFDLESNGLFAYRASICVIQLGAAGEVTIVDGLAVKMDGLRTLLGEDGPIKVVHDVAFDARMLAEVGVPLGRCHDTSLTARMLGKPATGLGSLLESELGVKVDKSMQSHDWRKRPFDDAALAYLASDVLHLEALDDTLWGAAEAAQITAEIDEETRYRLGTAAASATTKDPRPPWVRVKGVERVPPADLPVLRQVAALRERESARLDVPPYKVMGNEVLLAIAKAKPQNLDELRRVRGAMQGPRASAMAKEMLEAVRQGLAEPIPDEERAMIERPRIAPSIIKAQRGRETRIMGWRREEAKARGVDEQVVLPGHCVKDIAEDAPATLEELGTVPGLGAFRVERYGAAILRAVLGEGP